MDDRRRYETVKSRLRAMGQGTAQQVHDAIVPSPYSVREVEKALDEMALAEPCARGMGSQRHIEA